MIGALVFLVMAVALFFYVLLPFFSEFSPIPELAAEKEVEEFLDSNINEFSQDFELGKITEEELRKFGDELKKED